MTSHIWKKCLNYWWIKSIINLGRLVWSTLTHNKCQEDELSATWKGRNRKGKWNVAFVKSKICKNPYAQRNLDHCWDFLTNENKRKGASHELRKLQTDKNFTSVGAKPPDLCTARHHYSMGQKHLHHLRETT